MRSSHVSQRLRYVSRASILSIPLGLVICSVSVHFGWVQDSFLAFFASTGSRY